MSPNVTVRRQGRQLAAGAQFPGITGLFLFLGLVMLGCGQDQAAPAPSPQNVAAVAEVDRVALAVDERPSRRYFFDVHGHSSAQVKDLLMRAKAIYDSTSEGSRRNLDIAMVLHGPDIKYFATANYDNYQSLVDLAAKLDAFGFIDLKVCAKSAEAQGIAADGFPHFIEVVPLGPAEVSALKEKGYNQL